MELIQRTIGQCLRLRAEETPLHTGMSCGDIRYSWKDIHEITDFIAVQYLKMGIGYRSQAAIWSVNSPGWVFCFYALVKLGAIPVMINTCYKADELESLLKRMNVEYLFYGEGIRGIHFESLLQQVDKSQLPRLKACLPLELTDGGAWPVRTDYSPVMSFRDARRLKEAAEQVNCFDTACILPTSGTTNRPKGVMLSHHSLVNNSAEISRQMRWGMEDVFCISVPMFHCFGISTGILATLHCGATLHVVKYYRTLEVLEEIEQHRCTVLNGVPTMFLALVKNSKRVLYDLSSLKSGIIAGSSITSTEYSCICRSLNMEHLQVSYGQTESSPCISISDYQDPFDVKARTAGKVIPGIEVKIQTSDEKKEKGTGGQGEILTRGYHVMQGYYGMAEETERTVDRDGWLHTGDIGSLDENGYLRITGRMKDIIIRGGENISPLEIEECLLQMKEIDQVKILGVQADVLQEEIAACIIPKPGMTVDEDRVRAFTRTKLADYKVPKYVVIFEDFPLGAGGKIQTGELKRLVYQLIEAKK